MDRATRRRQVHEQPVVHSAGKRIVVCGFCQDSQGTMVRAGNGVLVHKDCVIVYDMGHEGEVDPKAQAKSLRRLRAEKEEFN